MTKIVSITAVILVLVVCSVVSIAQAVNQETLISRIKSNYQGLTSFQADIHIKRIEKEQEQEGEGRIWARKGKLRMEIGEIASDSGEEETSDKEIIVFDGNVFWFHCYFKPSCSNYL